MSFFGICISSRKEGENKSYTVTQRNLHHVQKFPSFSSFFHRSGLASVVMNEYELRFFSYIQGILDRFFFFLSNLPQ